MKFTFSNEAIDLLTMVQFQLPKAMAKYASEIKSYELISDDNGPVKLTLWDVREPTDDTPPIAIYEYRPKQE